MTAFGLNFGKGVAFGTGLNISPKVSPIDGVFRPRERSHITSSAEGGRGFPKDDGGRGGLWSDDVIQNRSISGFFIS